MGSAATGNSPAKPDEEAAEGVDKAVAGAVQRLDKWLWFARVIKTRTQAAGLVTDGKVRVNRQRVDKPSQSLRAGDVVTVTVRGRVRVLKMLAPGTRRGPPAEARTLFEEIAPDPARNPANTALQGAPARERGQGRPTKRDRRRLDHLKQREE